jgi:hypothetical protein
VAAAQKRGADKLDGVSNRMGVIPAD